MVPGIASSIEEERMTDPEKVRENRLRRMAARQGLALHKNRRRDPRARDYGLYWLLWLDIETPDHQSHDAWIGYPNGFTLDEVEAYLTGDTADQRTP
jgi:hypothetical protein